MNNRRTYDKWAEAQSEIAEKYQSILNSSASLKESKSEDKDRLIKILEEEGYANPVLDLDGRNLKTT